MITLINLVLGVATVSLSVAVGFIFFQKSKNLKNTNKALTLALSWQLMGEATIGFGTLIFAMAAHTGYLDSWSTSLQSVIRLIMFLATSATTWHLYMTIKKIREA
jgi:hypothetical protein